MPSPTSSSSRRSPPDSAPDGLRREALHAFSRRVRGDYEACLKQLVEVPTVSSEPGHRPDIEKGVALAAAMIRRVGGQAQVLPTRGSPVLHGVFDTGQGLPTVTVYNHLDVQPASRQTEPWETDPFVFVPRGDRYFGRGTTDDKGPALAALFGMLAAREAGVPINVRFLWEFEEEIGSPHFEEAVARNTPALATDAVVVPDTVWVSRRRPAIPSGLRGLLALRFTLKTGEWDTHSGEAGGAARNPIGELMQLMCGIHDPRTGRVKLPGFYDDIVKPTSAEIDDFRRCGFSLPGFKKDLHLRSLRTEDRLEVMKRIWTLPTFEIHGVRGGYPGPGLKTIIPGQAEVKVTCRLVPGQKPRKIAALVKAFVRRRRPDVRVQVQMSLPAYRGVVGGPLASALRRSIRFAFGREPAYVRSGGGIGAVIPMKEVLRCPVLFLGLSLPEHGYHAPNENFDWGQASGGMAAFARLFHEVSILPRSAPARATRARPRR